MTSNDNKQFITVEVYRAETGAIRTEINSGFNDMRKEFKEIHTEITAVRDIALVNSAKIEAYRDFTSIWFTVLAVIVAVVGIMVTLAPMFREIHKDAQQKRKDKQLTREEVQDMINSSVTQAVNKAIANALETSGK